MLVFISNDIILKKSQKHHFGAIVGPFSPNLAKKEFFWKKGYVSF